MAADKIVEMQAWADREAQRTPPDVQEPRKLTGIDFADMRPHLADGHCIKGLIGKNSMVGIIGTTGSGKTFLATDIACHIAANRPWRTHQVAGGLVIYCGLEGPLSVENRLVAARNEHDFATSLPLRLTPGPINLRDAADVLLLIDFIRDAESDHGEKCAAVFIDTLSRAISGGDENGPEDMGALIAGADAVRLATGATVVLVHHLGKDETRGARGHSSFKAATDTEIEVSIKDDVRVATVTKQRDLPTGTRFAFKLASVELGVDADGEPVTSCVVEHQDEVPVDRNRPSGKNQTALLTALQEWQRQHPGNDIVSSIEMQAIGKAQGIPRKRLQEASEGLQKFGWLVPCVGGFRFSPEVG